MNNENQTTEGTTSSKVGRPRIVLIWPEEPFTVESVHAISKISKVTLYNKIKEDLKAQLIEPYGEQKSDGGRPRRVYRKKNVIVSNTPAQVQSPSVLLSPVVA